MSERQQYATTWSLHASSHILCIIKSSSTILIGLFHVWHHWKFLPNNNTTIYSQFFFLPYIFCLGCNSKFLYVCNHIVIISEETASSYFQVPSVHLCGPKQFPLHIALPLFWYLSRPCTVSRVVLQYNNHNVKKTKVKETFPPFIYWE